MGNLQTKAHQAQEQAEQALAIGLREGLLAILDARGISCPDEARAHIESCTEPSTLRRWLARAKTLSLVEEIFSADTSEPEAR